MELRAEEISQIIKEQITDCQGIWFRKSYDNGAC